MCLKSESKTVALRWFLSPGGYSDIFILTKARAIFFFWGGGSKLEFQYFGGVLRKMIFFGV